MTDKPKLEEILDQAIPIPIINAVDKPAGKILKDGPTPTLNGTVMVKPRELIKAAADLLNFIVEQTEVSKIIKP